MSVVVADESQEDPKKGLANKYDLCLQQKEDENKQRHKIHRLLSQVPQNQKKASEHDSVPAPDPSLPPLKKLKNEPFGDNSIMKLQGEEVLDKLNDFADSTLEFGSALIKRLISAETFSAINY